MIFPIKLTIFFKWSLLHYIQGVKIPFSQNGIPSQTLQVKKWNWISLYCFIFYAGVKFSLLTFVNIYYLEWVTTKFIRVRFSSKWIQGCFYHLHKPRGGNSVHKHKTMEFDVVGGRPTTNYIQITFDSEDDYCTGCRNISHYQQLFRTTFTRMMKRNLILYPNQLSRLKRVEKYYIIAKHSPHIFWSFPNKMSQTIWFFNQNFQFSEVNGNYPRTSNKES